MKNEHGDLGDFKQLFFKWWEKVDVRLTRGAQYVEYEACQHEGQNRSIVAEVSIT